MDSGGVALAVATVVATGVIYRYLSSAWENVDGSPRTVVVTGAGNGLGMNAARFLAEKGDHIVALDLDRAGLERLKEECPRGSVECYIMDVTDERSVAAVVDGLKHIKVIDAVVHFAGVLRFGTVVGLSGDEMDLVFKVNVLGVARVTRLFFPLFNRGRSGPPSRVIAVVSSPRPRASPHRRPRNCLSRTYQLRTTAPTPPPRSRWRTSRRPSAWSWGCVAVRTPPRCISHVAVPVVTINPGAFATDIIQSRPPPSQPNTVIGGVDLADLAIRGMDNYTHVHAKSPAVLAPTIYRAVHALRPRRRYTCNYSWEFLAMSVVPNVVMEWVMLRGLALFRSRVK